MRRAGIGAVAVLSIGCALAACTSDDAASPPQGGGIDAGSVDGTIGPVGHDAGREAGTETGTDSETETDSGTDSETETETGTDSETETDSGTDSETDADAGPAVNYVLSFDDTTQAQVVAVADDAKLRLTAAFTYEAWIAVVGPGHTTAASILGVPYGPNGAANGIDTTALWLQGGSLYAGVGLNGTPGAVTVAGSASNGAWHHVAWSYDGASGAEILYVDGVDVAHATSTAGTPLYDGHPFLVGADVDFGGATFGFQGLIDDVRVFASVRAPAQIAADMAGVSPLGDPALVAWYPFDEGAGTIAHDTSPNHLDGVLGDGDAGASAPTWTTATLPTSTPPADAGASGDAGTRYALQFDDTFEVQYVAIPDAAAIDLTGPLTYEAWVHVQGANHSGPACLLCKTVGTGVADSTALWLQNDATLYAGINLSSTSGAAAASWSAPNGAWHHVAWTYDGTTSLLYVDGTQVASGQNALGTASYDGHPLLVGADIDNEVVQFGWFGLIDDVRVFSSARTAQQIASDKSGASPVGDPALVVYYPLDEGAGLVAHDRSGHHLDGTLGAADAGAGAPTWVVSTAPFSP